MSGTAGLSSAKNRRSGNEVKINGQQKAFPPPEQTNTASTQPLVRHATTSNSLPNPMEILKSHEFRLQRLESENGEQDMLNHKVDYLTLKTDFLTLKNELLVNNKVGNVKTDTCTMKTDVCTMKTDPLNKNVSADVSVLQKQVVDLNTLISNMAKEITAIKHYIREKVDPVLTKVLMPVPVPLIVTAPVHVTAPVPLIVTAPVPVTAPALLDPLQVLAQVNTPSLEQLTSESLTILTLTEPILETIFDNNIILTVGL